MLYMAYFHVLECAIKMIASVTSILVLAFRVKADFNDAASDVVRAARALNNDIEHWNAGAGFQDALAAQSNFGPVSSALNIFAQSASSITNRELDVQAASHFSFAMINLLDNLESKAAQFHSVGVGSTVADNLKTMSDPMVEIINGLIKAGSENERKWEDIRGKVEQVEQKLNSANKAYNVDELSFSAFPTTFFTRVSLEVGPKKWDNMGVLSRSCKTESSGSESLPPASTLANMVCSEGTAVPISVGPTDHSHSGTNNSANTHALGAGIAAIGVAAFLF